MVFDVGVNKLMREISFIIKFYNLFKKYIIYKYLLNLLNIY